jgi:hypothetical protein
MFWRPLLISVSPLNVAPQVIVLMGLPIFRRIDHDGRLVIRSEITDLSDTERFKTSQPIPHDFVCSRK